MSIRAKLISTSFFFSFGIIVLLVSIMVSTERIKVNGPVYQEIERGKDLIADILPPPEYIIEAYLVALQALEEKKLS
jgi:methyl-accepting chemotaxis protein